VKKDLINKLKQNLEKLHAQQLEPLVQDNEDISPPQVEDPVITTPPNEQIKISTTPRPERPPVVVELPPCHDPCHPETWRRNCEIDNTSEPPSDYESQNCPFPNDVRRAQIVKLCETCPESPCLVAPDGRKIYDCETGQFNEALICELARDNYCQTGQLTVAGCPCLNPGNPMGFPNNPTGQSIDCWNCVQYLKPGGNFSYPPQTQNPCSLLDLTTTLDECTAKFLSEQSMGGKCGWSYCSITGCYQGLYMELCRALRSFSGSSPQIPGFNQPYVDPTTAPDDQKAICQLVKNYEERCRGKAVLNDETCNFCFKVSSFLTLIKKHINEGTLEILCNCCRSKQTPTGPRPIEFDCPTEIPDCIKNAVDFPPPKKGYAGDPCPNGLINVNECCCGYQDFAPNCRRKICVPRREDYQFRNRIRDKLKMKMLSCRKVYTTPSGITKPCRAGQCTDYCFDNPNAVTQFFDTFIYRLAEYHGGRMGSGRVNEICYLIPEGYDSVEQYIDAILDCDCEIEARYRERPQPFPDGTVPVQPSQPIACIINFNCDLWGEFTFGRNDCTGSETKPCFRFNPSRIPKLPDIPPPNGPVPPDPPTDSIG